MCRELASSSEWMPAVAMLSSAAASAMRMAISPRLAIRSFLIMVDLGMPKRLLIVAHAPSENTLALRGAVDRGARRGTVAGGAGRRAGSPGRDPRDDREPGLHERGAKRFLRPLLQSPAGQDAGTAVRALYPCRQRRHRHAPRGRDHPDRPALARRPGAVDLQGSVAAGLRRAMRGTGRGDGGGSGRR